MESLSGDRPADKAGPGPHAPTEADQAVILHIAEAVATRDYPRADRLSHELRARGWHLDRLARGRAAR